ncbi:FMN-dependent dehydrogenase-domain-containing protein [Flagelloscypha sp. PMI_526]|nr:FMN-dependent dehydrogenase-domain-containing protein [Flagelloscypha sp. PMI_526]
MSSSYSLEAISEHNSRQSAWVIIKNQVYDVTEFLDEHPGGAAIILKYAGKDATSAYEPIHPSDALAKSLPGEKHLGPIDPNAADSILRTRTQSQTKDEKRVEEALRARPPLERILNLHDMEVVARKVLSYKALSYYASATDDEISLQENANAFSRFFFNARVMRRVSQCDTSTSILGYRSSIPVFVSGAALAKLGHPDGEANITRGTSRKNDIIQMVSSNASLSYADIAHAASPEQTLFFQLYKHSDNRLAKRRAIFLTVDAVVPSNRERDIRAPFVIEDYESGTSPIYVEGQRSVAADDLGTAGGLIAGYDADMTFEETIPWLRSVTKLPIAIKGIQCVEDAVLAAEAGVDAILLSNHGGRQLEYSMPPMEVLYRLRRQRPDVFDKCEVYIDGGITRGTEVVKALCLGAKAVGLGRPFLYAQSVRFSFVLLRITSSCRLTRSFLRLTEPTGVERIVNILEKEIASAMRLLGVSSVKQLERVDWQPALRSRL